jgi:ice-binding like protein/PEP-CTERM motif-containing protein
MKNSLFILSAIAGLTGVQPPAKAQSVITLGSAQNFAVLAGTSIASTGANAIFGDIGTSPGATITGFPPGVVHGTIYAGGSVPAQAETDVGIAYNVLMGETVTQDLSGQDLGTRVLTTGVYGFGTAAQLTGTLTLDGGNNPNARFDFLIGSTLITAVGSQIILINGAQLSNIFWQVGSSATLGSNSLFEGNLLALTSITENSGVEMDGRLLAENGTVTLNGATVTAVPEPAVTALLVAGFAGLAVVGWRFRRHDNRSGVLRVG